MTVICRSAGSPFRRSSLNPFVSDEKNPKDVVTFFVPPDYEQAIKDQFDNQEHPLVFNF